MKKTIITIVLVCISYLGFAQKLTENMKAAFKADNAEELLADVKSQKLSINDCIEIEGSSNSLFSIAIKMSRPKILDALITQKADLNKFCNDKSPLMYTAKYGQLEMAKALIKAGANYQLTNKEGKTALDYAIKYEKKDVADFLTSLKNTK